LVGALNFEYGNFENGKLRKRELLDQGDIQNITILEVKMVLKLSSLIDFEVRNDLI